MDKLHSTDSTTAHKHNRNIQVSDPDSRLHPLLHPQLQTQEELLQLPFTVSLATISSTPVLPITSNVGLNLQLSILKPTNHKSIPLSHR